MLLVLPIEMRSIVMSYITGIYILAIPPPPGKFFVHIEKQAGLEKRKGKGGEKKKKGEE